MSRTSMVAWAGLWIGFGLLSCRSTTPMDSGAGDPSAEPAVAHAADDAHPAHMAHPAQADERQSGATQRALREASASRPVELDYKDERQRLALLGLSYANQRVQVDPEHGAARIAGLDAADADAEFEAGRALAQGNALLESISAHTRAVLLRPDDGAMYEGLGDALRMARLETRAEAAYRTALDFESTALRHVKLAEMLWMRADREGAIAEASIARGLDPENGRASADLARWYYFTGDYSRAWEQLHLSERLGAPVPAQFRPLLARQMPEPRSERR